MTIQNLGRNDGKAMPQYNLDGFEGIFCFLENGSSSAWQFQLVFSFGEIIKAVFFTQRLSLPPTNDGLTAHIFPTWRGAF